MTNQLYHIQDETRERHTRHHPCPICDGFDEMPRGRGTRCHGYTLTFSDGRRQAWCAREQSPNERDGLFRHWLDDPPLHNPVPKAQGKRTPVAYYEYVDRYAELISRKVRYEPKYFAWGLASPYGLLVSLPTYWSLSAERA